MLGDYLVSLVKTTSFKTMIIVKNTKIPKNIG
jgi:hypothetical protein